MLKAGVRTSIKLPETMSFLGDSAFERCSSLERINLPPNAARFVDFLQRMDHFDIFFIALRSLFLIVFLHLSGFS